MRSFLLSLAFSLFLPIVATAQYSISGQVKDGDENITLPGANIVIEGTLQGVHTSRDGTFVIENLHRGTYTIIVSFLGYQQETRELVVEEDTEITIYLQRKLTLTEEVVVSALRADGKAPVTFVNIGAEELAPKNLGQDLPILLKHTPSLVFSTDAGAGVGYSWLNIRGSDQSRINVTLNGIPVNDAESHGVWWVNMPDVASSVESIQVQRGVGLSTHGTGAFGATINLQTTGLNDSPYAEINSSAGSFNTLKNTVSFGTGLISDKWSVDGRLSKITSDGFIDRASSDLKSFYLSGGYYGQNTMLKGVVMSGQESTYQAWYGVPSDSLNTNRTFNPAGMYFDADGNIQFYDNETDNYQQDHYQLHFSHAIHRGLIASGALHYTYGRGYYEQYRQNERFSRYNLPPAEIGDTIIDRSDLVRRRWLDNHFYGLTYSLDYNNYRGFSLVFGGAYNEYDGDHFGEIIWARHALNTDIRHRYYDNNGFKKDFNTFIKVNYELLPGLTLLADMQYRYVSYSFLGMAWVLGEVVPLQQKALFHFFNPKTGISYEINPSNRLYAFGGTANREPVRRDFTESSPESRPRHEVLRNVEIGYEHQQERFRLGANFYLMNYTDQLVLTGEINDVGGFSRTNIDDSYRLGLELEGAFIFNEMLRWSGNITLSRNKIKSFEEHVDKYDDDWNWIGMDVLTYENTDIAFSPSVIASSVLQFMPVQGLTVNFNSKYVGDQYIDNTMSRDRMLDAYFVNDLRINYALEPDLLHSLELVFQVNNIFNHEYESNAWIYKGLVGEQGLVVIDDGFFPQAGRHFMIGVNFRI